MFKLKIKSKNVLSHPLYENQTPVPQCEIGPVVFYLCRGMTSFPQVKELRLRAHSVEPHALLGDQLNEYVKQLNLNFN